MKKQRAGLTRSAFTTVGPGEPDEITAREDSIELYVPVAIREDGKEEGVTVKLRPRHIEAITAMHGDWWKSRWAALHEAGA